MIKRHPPRPRGQHQDFHFFAAADPAANIESQFARPVEAVPPQPVIQPDSLSRASNATEGTKCSEISIPVEPAPAASSAIQQSIEYLANVNDPRDLIGKPRPAFMDEIDALAASRPQPPAKRGKQAASSQARKSERAAGRVAEPAPGASHHERHCKICSHRDRAEIEADFIEWADPRDIVREYNISRASIYRHARAVGLFACRSRNLRFALGRLIESVDSVHPTPDSIVRAIHAFARINDEGQWVEPPAHVIVSSGGVRREAAAPPARRPIAISLESPALGNVIDVPAEAALPGPTSTPPIGGALAGAPIALSCVTRDSERVETDATC